MCLTMNASLLRDCIDKWGSPMQKVIAMEELAELTKELSKSIRGEQNRDQIVQEIGDVAIMLQQVKMIFDISNEEIQISIDKKMNRLSDRLMKA